MNPAETYQHSSASTDPLLSKATVISLTGLSSSTIDRWEKSGNFPPRVHLSSRRVCWRASQLEMWMHSLPLRDFGHATA